jgi:hypothetical protein
MHEHLWRGVDVRIRDAEDSYREMRASLAPPRQAGRLIAAGVVPDTRWQDNLDRHVKTFLSSVRSIPWIIEACFGKDLGSPEMKDWWKRLPPEEQQRRKTFSAKFRSDRETLDRHHLTNERNVSEHRLGYPNIEAKVVGPSGTEHIARPGVRIPAAEPRPLEANIDDDPAKQWAATEPPRPINPPRPDQYTIDGKPLFPECEAYLQLARDIRVRAQVICDAEHGGKHLSTPPAS